MNKIFLVTRPNHDYATNYLFYWSKSIIEFAIQRGFKVLDLLGKKANLTDFNSYIRKHNPRFVFFNGHGTEKIICGFENKSLVDMSNCKDVLCNKIIYARCCSSAARLGSWSVKQGADAFIGYSKPFKFYLSNDKVTRPLEDKIAELFLGPSNLIPSTILKGNTAGDAYQKSINAMFKNLLSALSSAATDEMKACAPLLLHDIKSQTIHGSRNASL